MMNNPGTTELGKGTGRHIRIWQERHRSRGGGPPRRPQRLLTVKGACEELHAGVSPVTSCMLTHPRSGRRMVYSVLGPQLSQGLEVIGGSNADTRPHDKFILF